MINKLLLTLLVGVALTSSGLAHDSDLTGILKKPDNADNLYALELDGGSGSFYLRGDCLIDIPEGIRIWVTGEIKTEIYNQDDDASSHLSPKRWRVFLQAERYRPISDPFDRIEPINVTISGDFENLAEALKPFARQTGLSVVVGPEANDKSTAMSLHYENIRAEKVLGDVLEPHDLGFRLVGQTIVISHKDVIMSLPQGPSLEDIIKAAEEGDPHAQWSLGAAFYLGSKGLKQDFELAEKWFIKSAEQGYAEAQFYLGDMHYRGHGVPKNMELATQWFTKAAAQGDERAQRSLQRLTEKNK